MISKCELVFFSHFRMNANAGTCWSRLFLTHFTTLFRMVTKISVKQILFPWLVQAREIKVIPEPPSAFFSVCKKCYQKLVSCWHVFWQIHKFQIHKLVSRRDHLNISTMYSVFDWKEFKIFSYRRAFLESTEISASEDLNALEKAPPQIIPLRILSGKGVVQIMPFRKLGGKFHFFLWFCTRKRSKTYIFATSWTIMECWKWAFRHDIYMY